MFSPLRSKSAPTSTDDVDNTWPPVNINSTVSSMCSTNTPFSSGSMKLNIHEKQNKATKFSATLPTLSMKQSSDSTRNSKHDATKSRCDSSSSGGRSSSNDNNLRKSVSAANDKLKIAIAKSMPRPLPKPSKEPAVRKDPLPKRLDRDDDNASLTEADFRQIAKERLNRSVKKQRMREQADKDAADMVRRNRADQIESKQRQRDRYRAEVYAVNAILKKLEMSRFDELRQERGSDRSFLEQCSTDDDETSMEDNACNDNNDSSNNSGNALSDVADRPITTITTTTTTTSTSTSTSTLKSAKLSLKGRDASKDRGRTGKDASSNKVQGGVREPVQSRGSKQAVSSRKLHLSSSPSPSSSSSSSSEQQQQLREKQKQREKHPSGGGATQEEVLTLSLQEKYQCPPHYVAPPSTSESEVCNFSFGV